MGWFPIIDPHQNKRLFCEEPDSRYLVGVVRTGPVRTAQCDHAEWQIITNQARPL